MTAQENELNTVFTKKSLYIGLQLYREGNLCKLNPIVIKITLHSYRRGQFIR